MRRGKQKEQIVEAAVVYSFNASDGSDGENPVEVKKDLSRFFIGQKIVTFAGAPGVGRWVYRITRIDKDGAWGVIEENSVRELTPAEVR